MVSLNREREGRLQLGCLVVLQRGEPKLLCFHSDLEGGGGESGSSPAISLVLSLYSVCQKVETLATPVVG